MADQALAPLREALDKRAAGIELSDEERAICQREMRGLERVLQYLPKLAAGQPLTQAERKDSGAWLKGGSQNIAPIAAAGAGRWDLLVGMARLAEATGLLGSEAWSPTRFYLGLVVESVMVALRDARLAGDQDAVQALERWLRAVWTGLALAAVRADQLEMHIRTASTTPVVSMTATRGVTCVPVGMRAKHGTVSDNHQSVLLSHALDVPRAGKVEKPAHRRLTRTLSALLGVKDYEEPTAAEPWGLTYEIRSLLLRVIDGDVKAAGDAMAMMLGTQAGGRWEYVRRRLPNGQLGVEKMFSGQANGNGPAVPVGQATEGGLLLAIQPDTTINGANQGLEAERAGGELRTRCKTHPEWIAIPELAGQLIYRVVVDGPHPADVHFSSKEG